MTDSNISFASNVNLITSDPTRMRNGDKDFFSRITDFYALKKLYEMCGNTTNSKMYRFPYDQKVILCGDFGFSVRSEDEKILKENDQKDELYGYKKYDPDILFPLIDELYLNYSESVWDKDHNWWERGNDLFDYSGNVGFSLWKPTKYQVGNVPISGGGTLFTSYISKEVEKIQGIEGKYIPIVDADLSELDEKDPYYYIYQKTAGAAEIDDVTIKNREADLYLQKYSIYNAFEETSQSKIIESDISENIFVDAGPGTGKTYTLMNKLVYMVDELEVDPETIVVLCFTNAAVAEIKKRKNDLSYEGASRAIRNVDVRTFHSFAWWLINVYNNEMQEENNWAHIDMNSLSYDGSIIRATKIIKDYPEVVLGGWKHFIVDEIQDLTDVRARMVLELINGCNKVGCGVTVLGDSCQAIYDYNQQEVLYPMTSTKFYKALFKMLFKNASMYKLTFNHRQTDSLIWITQGLREAILSEKIPEMKAEVKKLYDSMGRFEGRNISDSLSEKTLNELAGDGNVCLLCRNNGQVLRLSAQLRKRGISHTVNAYEHVKCFASWVGSVLYRYEKQQISQEEFIERYNRRTIDSYAKAEEVWDKIATILKKPDNVYLGIEEILSVIVTSQVDDPIFHNYSDSKIIVSNIHRAKGREYNAVIIDQNFIKGLIGPNKTDPGEFKTLYVAVTRPKNSLYSAHLIKSDIRIWQIYKTGSKRWVKFENRTLKYMEVRSTDINIESFNRLGNDVQTYITEKIVSGDEIILRRSKAHEILRYDIVHINDEGERVIGEINTILMDDMEAMLETEDHFQWPIEIHELYVTDVFSNIEFENDIIRDIWSWVDFCGVGRLVYDVY
ncbi:UvrD-helicase domain-containing protein [Oribacterium sp. FC2011]|uniref:UvrD-helicase domain-containing protein n=1 Tax=Oribacterium sp. FC2011 TaxID=1408311 RepID=UPI0004E0D5BE|nr:UvrD-helicase domain-containing protein [Oribacterium sp. FC2011]